MDFCDKSLDPDLPQRRRFHRQNPSFSSSLLDAIYRSIDESNGHAENGELIFCRKKQSIPAGGAEDDETVKFRRDFMIQKWMDEEKVKNIPNFTVSRSSSSESHGQGDDGELIFYRETTAGKKQSIPAGGSEDDETVKFRRDFMIEKWMDEEKVKNIRKFTISRSSSSESNGQGEDGELIFYRETTAGKKQIIPAGRTEHKETVKFRRDFMIRKWIDEKKANQIHNFTVSSSTSSESTSTAGRRISSSETERPSPIKTKTQNPKHENGFNKTKSKASKINHDSKKTKQPISPGGRLASFLNSLFNGGSPKTKQKIPNAKLDYDMSTKLKSQQGSSTCSSASSISRSCLSKTPSSRRFVKRSVRFCPVSVILDEDCRPCGHKLLQKLEEPIMKTEHYCEEEDDDDGMSCSSSDLFELDNLSVNGIERYREELPVYETTNFKTNCAIAKGLVV